MKLRVHEIQDAGTVDESVVLAPDLISLGNPPDCPILDGPVEAEIHAEALDGEILALVKVRARVRLSCSRCLEGFQTPLSESFEMHVSLKEVFLDVLEDVREAFLLALPVKPLCGAQCRGLCPRCGNNLNQTSCGCSKEQKDTLFSKLKGFQKRD